MKKIIALFCLFNFSYNISIAQTYQITYGKKVKINTTAIPTSGLSALMKKQLNKQLAYIENRVSIYYLTYANGVSVFELDTEKELADQDKSGIKKTDSSKTYKNFLKNEILITNNVLKENELVKENLQELFNWEICDETANIKGFKCKKAIAIDNGNEVEAWFTEEIPIREGPSYYSGLTGLILKLNIGNTFYEIIEMEVFKEKSAEINIPEKETHISLDELRKRIKRNL